MSELAAAASFDNEANKEAAKITHLGGWQGMDNPNFKDDGIDREKLVNTSSGWDSLTTPEAMNTFVPILDETGNFVNNEARLNVYEKHRYAIENDSSMKTFWLFPADGYEFPDVSSEDFEDAIDNPGNWQPERAAIHREIIQNEVQDALKLSRSLRKAEEERGVGPTIYAMRGLSAAGKTQAIKKIDGVVIEDGTTVGALSPDTAKRDLFAVSGGVTDQIHKESGSIRRRVERTVKAMALDVGVSDIRDSVMKDVADIELTIRDAEETKRRLEMIDIDVPLEVSATRLLLRPKGGADPNPNPGYLSKAFGGIRGNRAKAIEQLKTAYSEGRVGDVSYTLFCYDSESEPKVIQREAYKLWVDPETHELREEVLDQKLFDEATESPENAPAVLKGTVITPEYLDDYCRKYFNGDENSAKYEQELREGIAPYLALEKPMTLWEALQAKNE